ncbi:unnamed protein product, partial [Prunus brigantina]
QSSFCSILILWSAQKPTSCRRQSSRQNAVCIISSSLILLRLRRLVPFKFF